MNDEERIASLEREVRSLRRWLILGAVILVLFAARPSGVGEATFAAPFRVLDSKRQVILAVDTGAEGPELSLFGKDRKPVIRLRARDTRATIQAFDSRGEAFATL